MKEDKEIWKDTLKEGTEDRFATKPGGPNAKPLPKKEIFKTPKEKKLEDRVKTLEKQVKQLITEIRNTKQSTEELKRQIKVLKNKKSEGQKPNRIPIA